MHPIAPGEVLLDRYEVQAQIGAGGMATIFSARDLRSGKNVAIKQMIGGNDDVDVLRAWFRRELKALMLLDHPAIVRLLDYGGFEAGTPFVVTELLSGIDLQCAVEEHGPLPEAAALALAVELLDGLASAHRLGVVHRDLKPANFFLCFDGRAMLLDFGLARGQDASAGNTLASGLNTKIVGTFQYYSPDQLQGVKLSPQSDLFSFGSALYWIMSGQHAFTGDLPLRVIQKIAKGQHGDLAARAPGLRPESVRAVHSLIAFSPADRPRSAEEARDAFADALSRCGGSSRSLVHFARTLTVQAQRPAELRATQVASEATAVNEHTAISALTVIAGSTSVVTAPGVRPTPSRVLPLRAALGLVVIVSVVLIAMFLRRTLPADSSPATAPPINVAIPLPATLPVVSVPPVTRPPSVQPTPRGAAHAKAIGSVRIELKQWAEVFVDGAPYGRKQILLTLDLPPGTHALRFHNDRYGDRLEEVLVKRDKETSLVIDFRAEP